MPQHVLTGACGSGCKAPQQWDKTPHFPFTQQMTILEIPEEATKTLRWDKRSFKGYLHLLMAIKVHHALQPLKTTWGDFLKVFLKRKTIISEVHVGIRNQQLPALAQMGGNPPSNPFNTQAEHCERRDPQEEGGTDRRSSCCEFRRDPDSLPLHP